MCRYSAMEVSYQASNLAYPFVVSPITVISRPKVVFQHLTPLLHRECHSQPSNVFWDFVFTNLVLKLCDQHSAIVWPTDKYLFQLLICWLVRRSIRSRSTH